MDILDELLNEEVSVMSYTDDELIVNADDRTIYIPNTLAGVTSDEKSTRLKFRCPKSVGDNVDLSAMNVYINFRNANGDIYSYLTDDVTVDGTDITFSWLLSRDVTTYKGNVDFIICAKKIQSDGKIIIEWNTTLATLTVLEGLEPADSYIPTEKVDVATELMNAVNAVKAELNGVKESIPVVPTKVSAFENDKNYLNAIPDEYVTEEELNAKDLANKTYVAEEVSKAVKGGETLSGSTSYTVTDSVEYPLVGLKVYGKSDQKQYSGKNLLNATLGTTTQNGVTCTKNADGTYTLNGTATADTVFYLTGENTLNKNVPYKLVGCPKNGSSSTYKLDLFDDVNKLLYPDFGEGKTLNFEENKVLSNTRIVVYSGAACNNLVFKPMLTTDLTATYDDYEPYVGGIPSPNPDYPQEIVSVVEPMVTVCGKNLLNINSYSSDTLRTNEDGSLFINTNGGISINTNYFVLKANQTYRIYIELLSGTISGVNNSGMMSSAISSNYLNVNTTYTVSKNTDTEFKGIWLHNKGVYSNCIFRIMVWEGTDEYKYEPYVAKSLTISDTLNAIPVSSGGNVTTDGQEYIADYKDFGEGKCHRLVDPNKLDPAVSIVDNLDLLLETEEITDIPESELQAYRQLQTYNGTTNISNDKGAGLSVKYCTNKVLSEYALPLIKQLQDNSGGTSLSEDRVLELINTQLGVVENGTY